VEEAPVDRYEGFREFVCGSSARLCRAAYLLTGDHGLAEDLLQNALTKTASRWPQLRDGNPEGYVRRILYNDFVSAWRRRRVREEPGVEHLDAAAAADESADVVRRLALQDALATLPRRQRAVLVLRYFEDQTEAQAAELLGCSIGTVKSQAHHALARLRTSAPELADLLEVGGTA
jgi:RNA polymerase sigma-70 factor (sigma-E family)